MQKKPGQALECARKFESLRLVVCDILSGLYFDLSFLAIMVYVQFFNLLHELPGMFMRPSLKGYLGTVCDA